MATAKAKNLADFKAQFDPNVLIPSKIRTALAALLKEGPESWEYELDLIKRAGISQTQMAQFRDQFTKHIVNVKSLANRTPRNVWFADQKVASKARGE